MDLVKTLDGHFLAAMAAAGGGGHLVRLEGALAVVNPRVRSTTLNFITLRDASTDRLPEVLARGAAVLAGYGRPPAVYLTPLAGDLPALRERMSGLGWRRHTTGAVLWAPLPATCLPAPPAVEVEAIGPDQLERWLDLLTEGYEASPDAALQVRATWSPLMSHPDTRFYLARVGARPAGTGLLWLQGATAGLYCGAVRPALRRRGAETALIIRRMADAAESGATLVTLQTEQGSAVERLCTQRFGFQTAYPMELWLPSR